MPFPAIDRGPRYAPSDGREALIAAAVMGRLGATGRAGNSASAPGPMTSGGRLSVQVVGQGPDVVLLPGLASSRAVWAGTVARLKAHYRLHLVQVAGFAGEPAGANGSGNVLEPIVAELEQYLKRQGSVRPTLVGHSMGGMIALMLSARAPGAVAHVVVVDALPFFGLLHSRDATVDRARPRAETVRRQILEATAARFRSGQKAAISRLVNHPRARAAALAWSLASDRRVVAEAVYELMTTDIRPELANAAARLDVIFAYDRPFGRPERIERLFRNAYSDVRAAHFHRVDNARHFVMLDRPVLFDRLLRSLLATGRDPP